jgi:dihydrofolate reductase
MRKLIMQQWVSLDGYVADKNGSLDFFSARGDEDNKYSDTRQLNFLDTVDAILFGRITYELFADFWPAVTNDIEPIADKLNETRKFVFSNTLTKAPWGKWADAEVINGDAIVAVKKLKASPGKNMVLWGGISLARQLMQENLIDEYHIQICPILLGGGRKLFSDDTDTKKLMLYDLQRDDTGVVLLKYQII